MNKCDCCKKTEDEQGSIFDCVVWDYKGKDFLLCDDCFFNETYKKQEDEKNGRSK